MSSIERTAYPRFVTGRVLKERELEQFYSMTPDELNDVYKNIRGAEMQLNFAVQIAYQTSQTMNHPADIINVVIEELIRHRYELPTFNQLNRLVEHTRSLVNRKIFQRIYQQLDPRFLKVLDDLFVLDMSIFTSHKSLCGKWVGIPARGVRASF